MGKSNLAGQNRFFWLIGILGFVLAASSGLLLAVEISPYFRTGETASARLLNEPPGSTALGWSNSGAHTIMRDCLLTVGNPNRSEMRSLGGASRSQLADTCLALGNEAVQRFPTSSYFYLVRGLAHLARNDVDLFNQDFLLSYRTGATEQWMAELRIAIAEENFSRLSADSIAAEAEDIRLLMVSNKGLRSLSSRYINMPAFRARIAEIAATMPADVQSMFVRTLQRSLPR